MTLITGRGAGSPTVQLYSLPLLKGGNALWVKVKGRKHDRLREEKIPALRDTPKISVIQEETSLLHQEMNLETQTEEMCEGNETRGER